MYRITPGYRLPFFIALVLHAVLFLSLWIHVPAHQYRLSGPVSKPHPQPIEAVAVDSKRVAAQIAHIKRQKARKKAEEQAHIRRLQAKAVAARKTRLQEQHRLTEIKAQRLRAEQEKAYIEREKRRVVKEKQQLEREKRHTEQEKLRIEHQRAVAAARLKALQTKRKKILKSQSKQLQHQLLQQQLRAEQKQLATVKAAQLQGILNRYKAAILREIGQKWIVPGGANENLACIYSVQLAPGGVVVSVTLLHSSGNVALDQSAQAAIYKASPVSGPLRPHQRVAFSNKRYRQDGWLPNDLAAVSSIARVF